MLDFLKKLFGGKDRVGDETLPPVSSPSRPSPSGEALDPDATVPLPELGSKTSPDSQLIQLPKGSDTRFTIGVAQHVGKVRSHNEDTLLVVTGELSGLEPMPNFGVFVVADGMGGHSLGERASGVAARTMARAVLDQVLPSLLADPQSDPDRPLLTEVMETAMLAANRAVVKNVPDGGTTLTSALVIGEQLVLSHVGDSRAYTISEGVFEQITRDHSLVQRLKELGQLTDDEAAVHPQRSVLYKAIGQGEGLEVDIISRRLLPGTVLLLCSDGLWSFVPDQLMMQIIRQSASLQVACDELVKAANEAGGPDNITVVMVQLPG